MRIFRIRQSYKKRGQNRRHYVTFAILGFCLVMCFSIGHVDVSYAQPLKKGPVPCPGGDFLGFPKWYEYLNCTAAPNPGDPSAAAVYTPQLSSINDLWLIVAAILELLLRLATLFAVGLVIWGGIQYIMSQGEPDKTTKARGTIINALIGLTICVISAATVAFVAGSFR